MRGATVADALSPGRSRWNTRCSRAARSSREVRGVMLTSTRRRPSRRARRSDRAGRPDRWRHRSRHRRGAGTGRRHRRRSRRGGPDAGRRPSGRRYGSITTSWPRAESTTRTGAVAVGCSAIGPLAGPQRPRGRMHSCVDCARPVRPHVPDSFTARSSRAMPALVLRWAYRRRYGVSSRATATTRDGLRRRRVAGRCCCLSRPCSRRRPARGRCPRRAFSAGRRTRGTRGRCARCR